MGSCQSRFIRAVPRIFCLRGQTPQTFTGISRIQTGFLVGRFVFTPISFPGGGNCSFTAHFPPRNVAVFDDKFLLEYNTQTYTSTFP